MEQNANVLLHAFKDKESGKWGFKDDNDEVVVPPQWRLIYHKFDEGMCAVVDDDKKVGFVNETGKLVIPCQYESHSYFSEGLDFQLLRFLISTVVCLSGMLLMRLSSFCLPNTCRVFLTSLHLTTSPSTRTILTMQK